MKKYAYQILRYMPDRVSGEFVNVGLVLFNHENKFLKAGTINKIGRVKHLYPHVKAKALIRKLRSFSEAINQISCQWQKEIEFNNHKSLKSITVSVLPDDDSSIVLSEEFTGLDLNFNNAFDDLFHRMVLKHELDIGKYLSDKDVWLTYYKSYFDKYNYRDKLEKKIVKTEGDSLKFDYAVKNGKWNFLEPVAFDLSKVSNIKEKVYKWMGRLNELDSSDEVFNLYLLSKLPDDKALRKFINDRISRSNGDNFDVMIIEPKDADAFARKLKEELKLS